MDDVGRLVDLLHFRHPDGIRPVFADIEGPAFFPGGTGVVCDGRAARMLPTNGVLVLGHNFDTEASYERTKRRGREDETNQTWRGLKTFLGSCGISMASCFFTNALMGVMQVPSAKGRHVGHSDPVFRAGCHRVFAESVALQRPRLILGLGIPALNFLGEAIPELASWRLVKSFPSLDGSVPGPVRTGLQVAACSNPIAAVGVVHPSYRHINARYRRFQGTEGHSAEVAMVATAWSNSIRLPSWRVGGLGTSARGFLRLRRGSPPTLL